MTNEEIYYQQFKNAQYPMTIYLAQCTTFIVDLMDLAREEGFGEGLKFSVDLLKCNIDAHKAQKKKEKEQ